MAGLTLRLSLLSPIPGRANPAGQTPDDEGFWRLTSAERLTSMDDPLDRDGRFDRVCNHWTWQFTETSAAQTLRADQGCPGAPTDVDDRSAFECGPMPAVLSPNERHWLMATLTNGSHTVDTWEQPARILAIRTAAPPHPGGQPQAIGPTARWRGECGIVLDRPGIIWGKSASGGPAWQRCHSASTAIWRCVPPTTPHSAPMASASHACAM